MKGIERTSKYYEDQVLCSYLFLETKNSSHKFTRSSLAALLYNKQFRFTRGHSTTVDLTSIIIYVFEESCDDLCIFCDITKASHTLKHLTEISKITYTDVVTDKWVYFECFLKYLSASLKWIHSKFYPWVNFFIITAKWFKLIL